MYRWSKDRTLPELKSSLETISKTANILITSIDRHFQEICKEQGIDLTARQPEQDRPAADLSDTPEQFISDLLPLSRDQAEKLLEQDLTVYMVEAGENPAMVFDQDDLMEQPEGTMFAVPREEWEKTQDFRQAVADRMNHQEDRERAFLGHAGDCFAIYQVSREDPQNARFMSMDWLKSHGLSPGAEQL